MLLNEVQNIGSHTFRQQTNQLALYNIYKILKLI